MNFNAGQVFPDHLWPLNICPQSLTISEAKLKLKLWAKGWGFLKSLRSVVTRHDKNTDGDETLLLINDRRWPACLFRTQKELSLSQLIVHAEMSDDVSIVVINSIECVSYARVNMI